jgi:4-hydroxy-tetrahydrodipicolinate synthase
MTTPEPLHGVIAAAATPITAPGEPDLPRFLALCRWLLANGCDGLNICGTTGEATSFTTAQRMAIMGAAAAELPPARLMAGTGAASVGDAVPLTRHAAELGLAAALLLPPFYYKGVDEDGILAYFERIVEATAAKPVPLYLYNFPALSGVEYTPSLVRRLLEKFPERIRGLKDSSGNLAYAAEIAALSPELRVFPSNEAILLRARAGEFAGCISASANVNAPSCGRAYRDGDEAALERATRIRALLSRKPLIPSVKVGLALRFDDPAFEPVLPPLSRLPDDAKDELVRELRPLLA